jgi:hypothetical protein
MEYLSTEKRLTMSKLMGLIKALIPDFRTQKERDLDYLNSSVDIFDVERRLAEIDRRDNRFLWQQPAIEWNSW